jgi:hypothetical protein
MLPYNKFVVLKKSTVLTANHSFWSSPCGNMTACLRSPLPRVAFAMRCSSCLLLPFSYCFPIQLLKHACYSLGLNVLFLSLLVMLVYRIANIQDTKYHTSMMDSLFIVVVICNHKSPKCFCTCI